MNKETNKETISEKEQKENKYLGEISKAEGKALRHVLITTFLSVFLSTFALVILGGFVLRDAGDRTVNLLVSGLFVGLMVGNWAGTDATNQIWSVKMKYLNTNNEEEKKEDSEEKQSEQ